MFSGHGAGEGLLQPCFQAGEADAKEKILSDSQTIKTVNPSVWLFGCRSLAFKHPMLLNNSTTGPTGLAYQPTNSLLSTLMHYRADGVFGCTNNSITPLLDPIQTEVIQRHGKGKDGTCEVL